MAGDSLAVLTGDIVNSARLPQGGLDGVIARLAGAADAIWSWDERDGDARFGRFRGDGWQCLLPNPEGGLRAMLALRAAVRSLGRGLDTRISLGIGAGTLPPDGDLAAAGGPAFEVSGKGLDGMGRAARFAIGWAEPAPCAASVGAVIALADAISRRWTQRQAQVFSLALVPGAPTQEEMGRALGVSQQMVAKHLAAGGDRALQVALVALEGGSR